MTSAMITIAVPLTRADRQKAQAFKDQQPIAEKADQIYENTLAVLATHHYLDMIDVPADLDRSYSQDPSTFLASNIADLYVPARGRLECRVVRESENACFIPAEVWRNSDQHDRIGYVVVRLNETNTEATVLGFVPEVSVERLPLSYLQSLDDLIDRLVGASQKPRFKVGDWINGLSMPGWVALDHLFQPVAWAVRGDRQKDASVVRGSETPVQGSETPTKERLLEILQTTQSEDEQWQAVEQLKRIDPNNPACGVWWAMDLGTQFGGQSVALVLAIRKKTHQSIAILVQLRSLEDGGLPPNLELTIQDAASGQTFSSQAGARDARIQRRVTASPDDKFNIIIRLGDAIKEIEFI